MLQRNLFAGRRLQAGGRRSLLRHDKGDDEAVQTKGLGENEDQNHDDEKLVLLTNSTHTGVADNANGHASSEATETAAQTGSEVSEASEGRVHSTIHHDVFDSLVATNVKRFGKCNNTGLARSLDYVHKKKISLVHL